MRATKYGRGPVGSTVKSLHGHYSHARKTSPKGFSFVRTIERGGVLLRVGKKHGKWKTQSVLKRLK
jgi:hypothetical protein